MSHDFDNVVSYETEPGQDIELAADGPKAAPTASP